jgi:hypothetical protein
MGHAFFNTPNPPTGAVFTYYLKDGVQSAKKLRRAKEIEIEKAGGDTPYPGWNELRAEDQETEPAVFVMIRDNNGNLVRQVAANADKGLHRSNWDLRLPPPDPIDIHASGERPYWQPPPAGPMVLPGQYVATLAVQKDGVLTELGDGQAFTVKAMDLSPEITDDRRALQAFQLQVATLQRATAGANSAMSELANRIAHLQAAVIETPATSEGDRRRLRELSTRHAGISTALTGDATIGGRNEPVPMSIASRVNALYYGLVFTQSAVAGGYSDSYDIAAAEFTEALSALRALAADTAALESALEIKGAPWTPGRIPTWSVN